MARVELPGWVVDDETSIRREVQEWAELSPTELWELARSCARDVAWAISVSDVGDEIRTHTDPLPESSKRALARLRDQSGWGRGL